MTMFRVLMPLSFFMSVFCFGFLFFWVVNANRSMMMHTRARVVVVVGGFDWEYINTGTFVYNLLDG